MRKKILIYHILMKTRMIGGNNRMVGQITGGIVTYNNADIIKGCIQSILEHTASTFKLYIYDNCSKDDTVRIIKSAFPQVCVIEGKENRGFAFGHNEIICRVDSQLHVIINPDIFFENDVLGQMAAYMDEHPSVVQLSTEIKNMDGTVQYLPKLDPNFKFVILSKLKPFSYYRKQYTREDEHIVEPVEVLSNTGCFSMIRTAVLKQVHGYDTRFFMYFEDADLSRRLRQHGTLVYHPGMWVCHAWKRENTRNWRGICIFLTSMWKYFRKWRVS